MVVIVRYFDLFTLAITAKVVSLNSAHGEVYSIPHYVIDLQQVDGFLSVLQFLPPIKLTVNI